MQSSPVPWATSDTCKLVDEDQIVNYLKPKHFSRNAKGLIGQIQIFLNTGRVWRLAHFSEIAEVSPGGWFKGIIKLRRVDNHWYLWGVLLCVTCEQYTIRHDSLRGHTQLQQQLYYERYFDRKFRRLDREKARQAKVARDNGNLRRVREVYAYGIHTESEWTKLVEACGSRCLRCGSTAVSKDHVVPLSRGGTNFLDNLQPLCVPCNSWKGTRTLDLRDNSSPQIAKLLRDSGLPSKCTGGEGRSGNDDA